MTQPQLAVLETTDSTKSDNAKLKKAIQIRPSEAAWRFANVLKARNYCIDVSAWPPKPIEYGKAKSEMLDNLKYEFIAWINTTDFRVDAEDGYKKFLDGLVDRLISLLPRVYGAGFNPRHGPVFKNGNGVELANTYIPFMHPYTNDFVMPEILQEYLDLFVPNPEQQKIVVQYAAHIIQCPWVRPQWFLVLSGLQGTGKSLFYDIISMALGSNHCFDDNSYSQIDEKFSDVLTTNLLVHFDDAPVQDKTYTKIKHNVTRKFKSGQVKFVYGTFKHPVFARLIVSFNTAARPFLHEPGCRRSYYVAPCKHLNNSAEDSADFFDGFHTEFLSIPEAPAILNHWLWSVDISDFPLGSCPKTETYYQMSSNGSTVLEDALKEYTADGKIFHNKMLYEFLEDYGIPYPERQADKIKQTLTNRLYETSSRTVDERKNVNLWQPKAKRARSLYPEEVAEIAQALRHF